MRRKSGVLNWYQKLLLLGTAVHELAHAGTVRLCGGQINEIDLTSHVNHQGRYTLGHQIAISYAPLVVNTLLASLIAVWAVTLPDGTLPQQLSTVVGGVLSSSVITVGLQAAALGVGFVIAAAALPSYKDARNPYTTFRRQLSQPTVRQIITLPLALLVLLVGIIPLMFAYIRSRSTLLHLTSEITFATAVLLQATGVLVIVDPTEAAQLAGSYLSQLVSFVG